MSKTAFAVPALALLALFGGVSSAAAFGGPKSTPEEWQAKVSEQASLIGISVSEYTSLWATGKSFQEIADSKGISKEDLAAKMKVAAEAKHKAWLQSLVTKGFITQGQADARLEAMKTKQAARTELRESRKGRGHGFGKMMRAERS